MAGLDIKGFFQPKYDSTLWSYDHPLSHINARVAVQQDIYINRKKLCFSQMPNSNFQTFKSENLHIRISVPFLSQWSEDDEQKCTSTTAGKSVSDTAEAQTSKWRKEVKKPLRIWSDTKWGSISFSKVSWTYSSVPSQESHRNIRS